jgi:hypothetical protein
MVSHYIVANAEWHLNVMEEADAQRFEFHLVTVTITPRRDCPAYSGLRRRLEWHNFGGFKQETDFKTYPITHLFGPQASIKLIPTSSLPATRNTSMAA